MQYELEYTLTTPLKLLNAGSAVEGGVETFIERAKMKLNLVCRAGNIPMFGKFVSYFSMKTMVWVQVRVLCIQIRK